MELQTAFYIIGIIFMSLMTIIILIMLAAVLVIKAKINKFHDMLSERVDQAKSMVSGVTTGLNMIKRFVKR